MAEDGRLVGQSPANPGDPIGWLSVIDGKPMNASLVAAVNSAVLLIPSTIARNLLLPEPSVNQFVLQLLARGIRQHLDERRVLTLPNAFQRVFLHLHQLAQSAQAEGGPMLPKQQDIATSVNTSRETVSRAIQLLVKRGVLHKRGHQVIVLQRDQLKALANDPAASAATTGKPPAGN
jgi:CRP-like cAMP-binding protein